MTDSGRDPELHMTSSDAAYDMHTSETFVRRFSEISNDNEAIGSRLAKAIEAEILPRLLLVHREEQDESTPIGEINADTVEQFTQHLINDNAVAARQMVDSLLEEGAPLEAILLNLMSTAANCLGVMWETDQLDFASVTIGLCRMQELLRSYSIVGDHTFRRPRADDPSILLASACGDQHIFGLLIVAEVFRRNGWKTICEPALKAKELAEIVSQEAFSAVGLSLATTVEAADLKKEIDLIRSKSANKDVKILLGGAFVHQNHEIAEIVGADLILTDASQAPLATRAILADTAIGC